MFRVTSDMLVSNGTSGIGKICVKYSDLVLAFGEPLEGDEHKVSGEWIFQDEDTGAVFTIYDWKSTDLYHPHLPSVEQFRACETPQWFNIGGNHISDANDFKLLVLKQIEYVKREQKAEVALFGDSTPYFLKEG